MSGARLVADVLVVVHLAFVAFAVLGALLTIRWRWVPWLHVPCVVWAFWIEVSHGVCPLTPLENHFRRAAGQSGYPGGFVEHYLLPMLYPGSLTPAIQWVLGVGVVAVNVVAYTWLLRRRQRRSA